MSAHWLTWERRDVRVHVSARPAKRGQGEKSSESQTELPDPKELRRGSYLQTALPACTEKWDFTCATAPKFARQGGWSFLFCFGFSLLCSGSAPCRVLLQSSITTARRVAQGGEERAEVSAGLFCHCGAGESAGMSQKERPTFYRQELNKTVWEVPERYQNLSPVGSGAYGSVW